MKLILQHLSIRVKHLIFSGLILFFLFAPQTPSRGASFTPDNIYVNNGFEYGLMGFNLWVWSAIEGQGDYKFFLSNDKRSGNYALEIRCTGPNAGVGGNRAAVWSNIPTPGNQSYRLRVYAKCPAGGSGDIYVNNSTGQALWSFTCNGTWTMTECLFTTNPGTGSMLIYLRNTGAQNLLIDDISLTYADGTVPEQTINHAGDRIAVLINNIFYVDGSPYMPLGFFNVPYDQLDEAAALGVNTVTSLDNICGAHLFNTHLGDYPDRAYELGINIIPDSTSTTRLAEPGVFPGLIQTFSHHQANIAWLLADEPDLIAFSWYPVDANTLIQDYQQAKTRTSLPITVDLQRSWSVYTDMLLYAPAMDIWMAEPYSSNFWGVGQAINNFRIIEQELSLAARTIWLAQDDIEAARILPKAYWAVIKGARGLLFFTYDSFIDDAAQTAAAQQVFSEMSSLKDVIFSQDISAEITAYSGTDFQRTARRFNGDIYILAASDQAGSRNVTFQHSAFVSPAVATVLFENRTIPCADGSFSDTFNGTTRHVYRIGSGVSQVQVSGTITYNGGGLVNVVLNGLPENTVTNASGVYTANVNEGWSGTVRPIRTGYAFTPSQLVYSGVTTSRSGQDYTASTTPYSISGAITSSGNPLEGVTLNGLPGNPVTDAFGQYTANAHSGWIGTARPTLAGYTFAPASQTYAAGVTTPQTQDYTASASSSDSGSSAEGEGGGGGGCFIDSAGIGSSALKAAGLRLSVLFFMIMVLCRRVFKKEVVFKVGN